MDEISAYPLTWPVGRPRTKPGNRKDASFGAVRKGNYTDGRNYNARGKLTIAEGRDRALGELASMGADKIVLSTNVELRRDGLPYSGRTAPEDPGVAVYFRTDGQPRVIACDRWTTVADNLAAIAKTIEAQRGMVRWGAVTAAQIFEGLRALPAPGQSSNDLQSPESAAEHLSNLSEGGRITAVAILREPQIYLDHVRALTKRFHPDRNGGEPTPDWHKLLSAKAQLDKHHGRST